MINVLSKRFNFNIDIVYANQSWGSLVNGFWTASVGHLYNKMPFLQFFTTLPANKVPKDFVKKTGLLLSQVLRNKPLERICVHLMTDQNIFAGSDPNGNEDNAYALLRSWGSVTPDDNRKTVDQLTKHVKQELGINANQFRLFFVDLDPDLTAISGKILTDLMEK